MVAVLYVGYMEGMNPAITNVTMTTDKRKLCNTPIPNNMASTKNINGFYIALKSCNCTSKNIIHVYVY